MNSLDDLKRNPVLEELIVTGYYITIISLLLLLLSLYYYYYYYLFIIIIIISLSLSLYHYISLILLLLLFHYLFIIHYYYYTLLADDESINNINEDMILYRKIKADESLPILITAPHGGYAEFNNQSIKFIEREGGNIVKDKDLFTLELSAEIDKYLRDRLNRKPHYVGALFHRKYIDANRTERQEEYAYMYNENNHAGKDIYQKYHTKIKDCIANILSINQNRLIDSKLLLLDIHGFNNKERPARCIIIGTRNGTSCDANIMNEKWCGFCYIFRKIMRNRNLSIDILPIPGDLDDPSYSGAGTLELHGKEKNPLVNAIQLEFSRELRTDMQSRIQLSECIGEAIINTLYPLRFFVEIVAKKNPRNNNDLELQKHWTKMVCDKINRIGINQPKYLVSGNINQMLHSNNELRFYEETLKIFLSTYNENL